MEVSGEVLDNIQETFKTIVHEDGLAVHSFQEARSISGMKGLHNKLGPCHCFEKAPSIPRCIATLPESLCGA